MANIKRCDWCVKEYDRSQSYDEHPAIFIVSIYGVGETKYLCSEKCKEEMILDSIEDQKYNRKMKGK